MCGRLCTRIRGLVQVAANQDGPAQNVLWSVRSRQVGIFCWLWYNIDVVYELRRKMMAPRPLPPSHPGPNPPSLTSIELTAF